MVWRWRDASHVRDVVSPAPLLPFLGDDCQSCGYSSKRGTGKLDNEGNHARVEVREAFSSSSSGTCDVRTHTTLPLSARPARLRSGRDLAHLLCPQVPKVESSMLMRGLKLLSAPSVARVTHGTFDGHGERIASTYRCQSRRGR